MNLKTLLDLLTCFGGNQGFVLRVDSDRTEDPQTGMIADGDFGVGIEDGIVTIYGRESR